ncbi:DDE-type integrase/transposase/recombinase [Nitratidesulfovibrio vulgaris]|uniref:DDE-type integrase/transposase/recombinase n=1 Tax=Nitratidesulfovibrio vulgaris TaxID=881 RepID=UPI0023003DF3|nr:DDE-type integrase/transposase/recombinase [Nitratidesulfovibrio vulgaris]WCB46269.1 DDE-type integrase/transposase/recombinase [Nitratidesulfovibrio vulgaris]
MNHKCVERIYREKALSLRLKHCRKRASHLLVVPPGPMGPNQHWAMDFISDCLMNGRRLRMLTVVDLYDRCCPVIEVDYSLTGERIARVSDRLNALGQCPMIIRTDNGPEFTGKALDLWAHGRGVGLEFISPGKPKENGHIESSMAGFGKSA